MGLFLSSSLFWLVSFCESAFFMILSYMSCTPTATLSVDFHSISLFCLNAVSRISDKAFSSDICFGSSS